MPSPITLLKQRYFGEDARHPGVARKILAMLSQDLPPDAVPIATQAVEELIEFQDPDYALLYLDRLSRYVSHGANIDPGIVKHIAQLLSARMRFEDPIWAARGKLDEAGGMSALPNPASSTRAERYRWHEILTLLPPSAAAPAMNLFARLRLMRFVDRSVTFKFSYATRLSLLWLKAIAGLRIARPYSQRFKSEKAWVERWLHMIDRSLVKQPDATAEVVETAKLIKGHGDPYFEGLGKWNVIIDRLIKPACDQAAPLQTLADAIEKARVEAMTGMSANQMREAVDALRLQCLATR